MKKVNSIYSQLDNKKKAFTLIELLIVIAIIGILFIVLVSKVDFATDKAKASGVQTDFRSFQVALDTVAKENAGFNTLGYNTGDNAGAIPSGYAFESTEAENKTKGDGIRNSYDQGDKNLNGKQDGTEVFTGRKIYTEKWTEVYTLVKPGTTGLDADAIFALESAINANLDPKLHITIASDGKITMANQARDPWKNEYHGVYISQAERDHGADRGAIIMYSNGPNGKWGSAHDITNGVVSVTVPGNNVNGKDDYSIVSCYTFTNGYGEVLNMSTGFSNNQSFQTNNNYNPSVIPGDDDNQEPSIGITYDVIEGAGATFIATNGTDLVFKSSANFDKFVGVEIDGNTISSDHYTASSGSTKIVLRKEYIDTLAAGVHSITIVSSDGEATSSFNIINYGQNISISLNDDFGVGMISAPESMPWSMVAQEMFNIELYTPAGNLYATWSLLADSNQVTVYCSRPSPVGGDCIKVSPNDKFGDYSYYFASDYSGGQAALYGIPKESNSTPEETIRLITFTVANKTYYAEEGMTWDQWIVSDYNVDKKIDNLSGFVGYENRYFLLYNGEYQIHTSYENAASNIIVNNANYDLEEL